MKINSLKLLKELAEKNDAFCTCDLNTDEGELCDDCSLLWKMFYELTDDQSFGTYLI